ncbi:MAG: hypothetical protein RL839_13335 [Gammaproteobacteria bacterium]
MIPRKSFIPFLFALLLLVTLSGCSNRNLYEAIQQNRLQSCEEIPIPQQANCREQYQQSYEDYKRERDALLQGQ